MVALERKEGLLVLLKIIKKYIYLFYCCIVHVSVITAVYRNECSELKLLLVEGTLSRVSKDLSALGLLFFFQFNLHL